MLVSALMERMMLYGEAFLRVGEAIRPSIITRPQGILHALSSARALQGQQPPCFTQFMDETLEWRPAQPSDDQRREYAIELPEPRAETARERALRLRRERNTGPAARRRLDGRTRPPTAAAC